MRSALRRARILATIDPYATTQKIRALLSAGTDVAHVGARSIDDALRIVGRVRDVAAGLGRSTPILVEVPACPGSPM